MLKSALTILGLILTFSSFSQRLDHAQGEVIIQFHPSVEHIQSVLNRYKQYNGRNTLIKTKQCLSESMQIWQFQFDFTKVHERQFLQTLRKDKRIQNAQFNHFINYRTTPNDPDFFQQWQYLNDGTMGGSLEADMDADLAWDITTGGVTINGDTIVIVALDDGMDLDHEDFGDNLWRNHGEIPDNGLDDDGNGYIDDVFGWNAGNNTGNVGNGGSHGTPVMGIMGAQGNNGIGVTGVNWDVKVMMVKTDFQADEATLLAGYGYPLALRKLYNETDGAEGAFIVATNASWGIDNGMPEDAPIWCALYDSLGTVGILNCGATVNENTNVDVDGDLPTTCPSEYLIGITNLNRVGEKEFFAGFGKQNIDLGAFGEDTYTVARGNRYAPFGGTSGATPHVTGAIGLLYAAPCNNFGDLMKSNPSAAALLVRQYLLEGVKPNEFLDTITATGGQLNLNNSIQLLMGACGPCPVPLSVNISNVIDVSAQISWISAAAETRAALRFRQMGSTNWTTIGDVSSPYQLMNLSACTDYEFELKSDCDSESSGYTRTFTFKTDGCCIPPENVRVTESTISSLNFEWDPLFAAKQYEIRFNPKGASDITLITTTDNFIAFADLSSCTDYEFQVRTICTNFTTDFSPLKGIRTNGCGSCTDMAYCESIGAFEDEWISNVDINTLSNITGSDGGYGDYTGMSTDLFTLETYEMRVNIGFQAFPFDENIQAWIDFNQDGTFDPETENIINLDEDISEELITNVTIPIDAEPGLTRMRVALKWREGNDPSKPGPCDKFDFGEVEDYCVNIIRSAAPCFVPSEIALLDDPISDIAFLTWKAAPGALSYGYRYRIQGMTDWTENTIENPATVFLSDLTRCATYELQVQSLCDSMEISDFSESFIFNTECDCSPPLNIRQLDTLPGELQIVWNATDQADKYEVNVNKVGETAVTRVVVTTNAARITSLDKCEAYEVKVRAFCLDTDGGFSSPIPAMTACEVAVTSVPLDVQNISVYPNPFREHLQLEITLRSQSSLRLNLFDVSGKIIQSNLFDSVPSGKQTIDLDFPNLLEGVYFLGIETNKGKTVRRVVRL